MSGHSKWATTKRHKDLVDAKRAGVFTKLSRNITIAARNGGDPDMNFSLRLAVDRAKAASMPKENIEKAIKKGTGELEGAILEEVMYECFAPGGVALLVEAVTDNRNRTMPEIKELLVKFGGSIGSQNSVKWMFEHKGVIFIANEQVKDKDEMMMFLVEFGADDVVEEEGGLAVYCGFNNFEKVKKQLEAKGVKVEFAEMAWVAKEKLKIDDAARQKIDALVEALEDHDDVNGVYTNVS